MRFGVCTGLSNASAAQAAGFHYIEPSAQSLLDALKPDSEWKGIEAATACPLPTPVANVMMPGSLKITGPEADPEKLRQYMTTLLGRAKRTRTNTIVFGSGAARNVPDGFDRATAGQQIIDFARMLAPIAKENDVTVVLEPLNGKECNIINSVAEAMEYVRAVNHPAFQCLADTYHMWVENEPMTSVQEYIKAIKHVHVADKDGRVAPGESGSADYRELFSILKQSSYTGLISIEASSFDIPTAGTRVYEFLQKQWKES
jgi:sugar phosphate isomerase/epimerase